MIYTNIKQEKLFSTLIIRTILYITILTILKKSFILTNAAII